MLLIPNLGAEEERPWDESAATLSEPISAAQRPAAWAASVQLWRALFAQEAQVLGDDTSLSRPSWPSGLGPQSGNAVFPWLDAPDAAAAWLNTPAAARAAQAAGRSLLGASPEIVRVVHDKAFAYRVASEERMFSSALREAIAVLEPELLCDPEAAVREINARVASWPAWMQSGFTLKPRLGTSGRGRVAGVGGRAQECRGGFERLAASGGVLLEPWLKRTADFATQLWVGGADELLLLGSAELVVDRSGLYRGHRGFVDSRGRVTSGSPHDETLRVSAVQLAQAAAAEGYRGPCGVDAFAYETDEGRCALRPVVELNARFTLGIVAIGMLRRALPRLKSDLSLEPGMLRAFEFRLNAPPGGWPERADGPGILWIPLADSDADTDAGPGLWVAEDRATLERCLAQESDSQSTRPKSAD
jgi:hypothetical protein